MEPPSVQYVRTEDGFDIAYTVTSQGLPLVFMPLPFSHRGLMWQSAFGRALCEGLAERFRLVQYDSRGQGMSTRGLPEYHSIEDYVIDLEAVIDHVVLDRLVLYAGPVFSHVAVRFAVQHPERVAALVLADVSWSRPGEPEGPFETLARQNWDAFLHTIVSSFSMSGAPRELAYWRESINREDWLRQTESARRSNLGELLRLVRVPTLILNTRRMADDVPASGFADFGQAAAAMIPGARLILFDGFASIWYSEGDEPPEGVLAIEDFVRNIGLFDDAGSASVQPAAAPATARLSRREIQVLRLLAEGKTNREIADALVLSEHTVVRHVSNIFTKTGVENRAAAATFGLRHGLV